MCSVVVVRSQSPQQSDFASMEAYELWVVVLTGKREGYLKKLIIAVLNKRPISTKKFINIKH